MNLKLTSMAVKHGDIITPKKLDILNLMEIKLRGTLDQPYFELLWDTRSDQIRESYERKIKFLILVEGISYDDLSSNIFYLGASKASSGKWHSLYMEEIQ